MRNNTELTMQVGIIADCCIAIKKAKEDYNKSIESLNKNQAYKDEFKKDLAKQYKTNLDAKILDFQAGIKESIEKIKGEVFKPMDKDSMSDIAQSVDYLVTMKSAGAINDAMINNEIEKYLSHETALLYFRQKCKDAGISPTYFDNHIFSEYQTDINGNTKFVEPTAYFDSLERVISGGNDILISNALKTTENILSVQSASLKNYDTAIAESHNDTTPTVI